MSKDIDPWKMGRNFKFDPEGSGYRCGYAIDSYIPTVPASRKRPELKHFEIHSYNNKITVIYSINDEIKKLEGTYETIQELNETIQTLSNALRKEFML